MKIRNIISRYNKNYFIRIKTQAERFHDHPQYEYTVLFTGEELENLMSLVWVRLAKIPNSKNIKTSGY